MQISQADFDSTEARDLLTLLKSEWNDLEKLEKVREGMAIPRPLVALADSGVVGGASFTSYHAPDNGEVVLWLNAVYIEPQFRGRGIASQLIRAATRISPTLYALTDVPQLYTKLGWQVHSEHDDGTIVRA